MRPCIFAATLFLAFATVAFAQAQPASPSAVPAGTISVGPLELGEDLMAIEIADKVEVGHAGKREEMSHAQEATATKADSPTPSGQGERRDGRQTAAVECKEV